MRRNRNKQRFSETRQKRIEEQKAEKANQSANNKSLLSLRLLCARKQSKLFLASLLLRNEHSLREKIARIVAEICIPNSICILRSAKRKSESFSCFSKQTNMRDSISGRQKLKIARGISRQKAKKIQQTKEEEENQLKSAKHKLNNA